MKLQTKIAIFVIAVLLSFFQFNIIATCSGCVEMLKIGKKAGYEIITNVSSLKADR